MRMKTMARMLGLPLLLASTAWMPARAADAQTLRIGAAAAVTSADPLFYNFTPNINLASHVFERLVDRDARARPRPGLAESWRLISDTVWEFKLRPGAKWQDGQDFTAEDVAFTISRVPNVPNSPGSYAGFVRTIERVEVIDPLTVRLHTKRPNPLLPVELGSVSIVSRHVGETATTADYNSGKAAIGTGPYRLVSFRPNEQAELVRNDAYWGGQVPWARVIYRTIPNDGARVAALLAGDVDMADQIPSANVARLQRDARVVLSQSPAFRVIYLQPGFAHDGELPFATDRNGKPLPRNPLRDVRVRRALSIAINRAALAERVMEGGAVPNGQWLPEGAYSYDPTIPVPAYDPDGARRLLAEAGFPEGFRLTLHTPNDRYPNDAKVAQAIAQTWTRAGIATQVEALPWTSYVSRYSKQEFAIWLVGWGNSTGEATSMLVNILGTPDRSISRGAANSSRYSNPELDAMTERATTTLDDAKREDLLREAVRTAINDVALIPLFQVANTWGLRAGLHHEARMDERTSAVDVTPAAGK